MKVWNVSEKQIEQMYNGNIITIGANAVLELSDDMAVWFLSKRDIRGKGLVQFKDGDDSNNRYSEGRTNMFNWANEKYEDYLLHCEEREAQKLQPLAPHAAIKEYKKIMDDYNAWKSLGGISPDSVKNSNFSNKIYACAECSFETKDKNEYLNHIKTHLGATNVNISPAANTSSGKVR
jgi:hypothetical protein